MESKEIGKTKCPACPSSDGFALYDDGHGYCFVCNHYEKNVEEEEDMAVTATSVFSLELFESQIEVPNFGYSQLDFAFK